MPHPHKRQHEQPRPHKAPTTSPLIGSIFAQPPPRLPPPPAPCMDGRKEFTFLLSLSSREPD